MHYLNKYEIIVIIVVITIIMIITIIIIIIIINYKLLLLLLFLCFFCSAGPMIGLLLISLGTGGIKPCVSAFGGDQFSASQVTCISVDPPTQKKTFLIKTMLTLSRPRGLPIEIEIVWR